LHALWTLEGLQSIHLPTLKKALGDKDQRVKIAAIRISEPYLNNPEIFGIVRGLAQEENAEIVQQVLLSFRTRNEETKSIVKDIVNRFPINEVIQVTAKENLNPSFSQIQALKEQYKLRGEAATQVLNGFRLFQENCASCHGQGGKGTPQLAPSLVGSPRLKGDASFAIKILLHGLTGPVNGVEYNGPMASQAQYTDEEIADIISYVKEHLNGSGTVWRGNVRSIREKYKDRKDYWTLDELAKEKN
ncbi:MAG TPA: cytochrome c, partial [Chitinophagaceae bacterium]|nr:cytochrome c [Chitinophagaceae bacterium]